MASNKTKIHKWWKKYAGGGLVVLLVFLILNFLLSLIVSKEAFAKLVPFRGLVIIAFFIYFALCHLYVTSKGFGVIKPVGRVYEYKTKLGQSMGFAIGLLYLGISVWFLIQLINLIVK